MCKCSECKFGKDIIIFDSEPGTKYWWCSATLDCVDYEIGEDEEMDCEFYVKQLDADDTKA